MTALKSALAIFAHPDDETVLAGGLIALLATQGVDVHVVCATRGEGGELGEPPVAKSQSALGSVRESELRCAVEALGAKLIQLDYVDPIITEGETLHPFEADFETLAQQYAQIIMDTNAQLVLTHGTDGEYGHPAHVLVNKAVSRAINHYQPETLLYTICATIPDVPEEDRLLNQSDIAHYVLDITAWAQQKINAMECHISQHALFKRRRKLKTVVDALRSIESVRRVNPVWAYEAPPKDTFGDLLRLGGAWSPQDTDR